MRQYVNRDHRNCTMPHRIEIREPVCHDLNEKPVNSMMHRTIVDMPRYSINQDYNYEVHTQHQMVFEVVTFSTLVWIETRVDEFSLTSHGYYNIFRSYFYVPRGVELPQTELMIDNVVYHDTNTEPYHGLDGEAYYRYRLFELQRRLEELENERIILPREEIENIHNGVAVMNDKPIKVPQFDNDLFEV